MAQIDRAFIWTGDYASRLDALEAAGRAALTDKTPLLGGEKHPAAEIAEQYEALKDEADAAGIRVAYRGLDDVEWDEFVDEHPPRTDEQFAEGDKQYGYNLRTGLRPLILAGLVEPSFSTRAELDKWIREKSLSRGDLVGLAFKVWRLTNGVAQADPKSLPPLPTPGDDEN